MNEMIQRAADMIHDEMLMLGSHIDGADALHLATRLHEIWSERHEIRNIPAGQVAQRWWERYRDEAIADSTPDYLKPLLDDLTNLTPDR